MRVNVVIFFAAAVVVSLLALDNLAFGSRVTSVSMNGTEFLVVPAAVIVIIVVVIKVITTARSSIVAIPSSLTLLVLLILALGLL